MWTIVLFSGPVFHKGKVNWILFLPTERKGLNYAWYPFDGLKSTVNETGSMYFVIKRFIWLLLCFKIRNVVELK